MRTGTVATIDNRNWELRDQSGPVRRLSQSRAVALDMESATIAANGFRFRVPYGTLLCVSDKPLHGELKLPGMASISTRPRSAATCRSASARWSGCARCRWSGFTAGNCAVSRKRPSCKARKSRVKAAHFAILGLISAEKSKSGTLARCGGRPVPGRTLRTRRTKEDENVQADDQDPTGGRRRRRHGQRQEDRRRRAGRDCRGGRRAKSPPAAPSRCRALARWPARPAPSVRSATPPPARR
jgi:hypothetical protein